MVFGAGYGEQADARIVEYGFRHIGAAQDVGDGDGHDADDGGEHVPQAVAQQDPCPSEPLGPRQQHVISADFIQQLVADHVSVIPQVARHHDDERQDEVAQAVGHIAGFPDPVGTAARQQFEVDAENEHQHHAHPEGGHIKGYRTDAADEPIHESVLEPGAEEGKRDGEHKDQRVGDAAEHERIADKRRNDIEDGAFVFQGDAEIPLHDVPDPFSVLHPDGAVQPQPFPCGVQFRGRHGLHGVAVEGLERIAGGQAGYIENDQRQQKHHGDEHQRFPCERSHQLSAVHSLPSLERDPSDCSEILFRNTLFF